MMTKKKTSLVFGVKFAWALPAIALLLFAFAEPEYKTKAIETMNPVTIVQKGEKEFEIKGKVVREDNGKPLEGASVIIKGTSIGTVTDLDGKFTVTDPNPEMDEKTGGLGSELVVSYVGFETFEMKVGASGTALENGSFTCKMEEGVIYIDLPDYKNVPPPPPPPPVMYEKGDNKDEVFTIVEELPQYPGGIYDLAKYVTEMQENLAKIENVKGKVKIMFTVSETGKVTNIKSNEWDNQKALKSAATIVSQMPDWKPGSQHGKKVPVNYILPVEF